MKLLTISGLDGSGKSTQIQLLKNHFESQGKKVYYFHAIEFSIANIANRFLRPQKSVGNRKSVTQANWLQIQLRKVALIIDLWRFKKLYKKLEKENFDYILSDRYFYDTVINIHYLENSEISILKIQYLKFRRLNLQKITQPNLALYLQISPKIIMQRERKPDQGVKYLQNKKELYDRYSEIFGMRMINGNRDKSEVFDEIKKIIANSC